MPANLDIDAAGNLIYTAAAGETNNLTISFSGGDYVFNDTGATISLTGAGSGGWVGGGTNTVSGPVGSVTTITITLGDQNDTLTLSFASVFAPLSADGGGNAGDVASNLASTSVAGDLSLLGFQTININAVMAVAGNITLTAGGAVTLQGSLNTAAAAASGSVTLTAGGALTVNAGVNVLTGDAVTTSGGITVNAGSLSLAGALITGNVSDADAAGDQTPTSGSISVTAGTGITGAGTVTTGNASLTGADAAGADVATSGAISLVVTGAGDVGLSAANAVVTGDATRVGAAADTAVTGAIFLSADRVNNGTAGSPLDIQLGTPAGAATLTLGQVDVVTDGGAGALGEIQLTSDSALNIASLDTANATVQTVRVFTTANAALTFSGLIDLDADDVTFGGPTTGDLTQGATLTAGTLTGNAATLTVTGTITLTGAALLTADDMVIGANFFVNGDVTLQARTSPRIITLGSNPGGTLGLDDTELDLIATAGVLIIGSLANTGNLQLTGAITAPAGWSTLDLRTGGAITDNGGTITVTNLALRAATGIGAGNDINVVVTNLAAVNGTGNIQVTNTGALTVATVNLLVGVTITGAAGDIILIANSPLTINMPVSGPGNITLQAGDSAAAGDNLTINANVTSTGGGIITLIAGDDILHTAGTIQSTGGASNEVRYTADNEGAGVADGDRGEITQSGGNVVAGNVVFRAFENVTYTSAANDTVNLAANVTGAGFAFAYRDANALTVATVNGQAGITTVGGDVTLQTAGTAAGALTINQVITAGAGTVRFLAGTAALAGTVTQNAAGVITAAALGVLASGDVTLCAAVNDVDTLAVNRIGAANILIEFRDADDLTINTVAALAVGTIVFGGATGLVSGAGNINLRTAETGAGALTLNAVVNATTGDVRLVAGTAAITGTITQIAAGVVTADELGILASGDVTLCAALNDINALTINRLGAANILVEFLDVDDLTISALAAGGNCGFTGASGIVTGAGNINLASGSLTLIQPLNAGAGDIRIVATLVTQTTGAIIADELGILSSGNVLLCAVVNDVNTVAINRVGAANILIEFRDADDLIVGAVIAGGNCGFTGATGLVSGAGNINLRTAETGAGALTLNAVVNATTGDVRLVAGTAAITGTITQIAAGVVTADELGILASGNVTLCAAFNDVNTLAVNRLGAANILVEFRDSDDLTIGAVAAGGNCGFTGATGVVSGTGDINFSVGNLVINQPLNAGAGDIRIVAATTVTQAAAGVVTADELGIVAGGAVTLCAAVNDVNTLAVNRIAAANILVEFRDGDDLAIGTVAAGGGCGFTGATGVVSGTGDINLASGALAINQPLNAGTGDVRIVSGSVTQNAVGVITADELGILSAGAVTLCAAVNDVNTLAVNRIGAANILVEFRDGDDLAIGTVAAGGGCGFIGATGIISGTGNVNFNVASLNLTQPLNAGGGDIRIVAGTVTQNAAGVITANALGILASGDVTLCAAVNDVNTLAVNRIGAANILVEFRDGDDLAIGAVAAGGGCGFTGATGIISGIGNVNFNVGSLVINQPINAGTGDVRIVAATTVTQNATGVITADELGIQAGGGVTLCAAVNDVNTLAVNRIGAANILVEFRDGDDLTIGTVAAGGNCGFTGATGIVSGTGDINFNVGNLVINQPLNATTGDVRIVAATTVTQNATGVVTADELGIQAGGSVTLCAAVNDVNTLAVNRIGAANILVEFRDNDDLTVGAVAAGGGCGFTGATGIVSGTGNINLASGALTINQPLNAGTGDIRIVATTVTQAAAGVVTADELGIQASGNVTLCLAVNDVNTLAVGANGLVEFRDTDDLTIGTVAAGGGCGFAGVTGIVSGVGNINLAGGALTINQALNATTGDIRIVATTVTQNATGIVTANALGILASGDVTLCIAINDVNTLAVNRLGAANILVEFRDGDDLTIGAVAAGGGCGFTGATGVVSGTGNINFNVGNLVINQPLNATTGDIRIVAATTVTQNATGVITADELGIRAGGNITLTAAANDVNTLAASATQPAAINVQFSDADDLTVSEVAAGGGCGFTTTTGITTNNGNVTLNTGTALTINRNINAGTGTILINAGLTVSADVTVNNTAVITAATTTINTGAGADALVINSPAGSLFAPSGAFTFNAGGQAGDRLEFNGGGAAGLSEAYSVGPGNTEGLFTFAGLSTATLTFTGVTSPILDSITAGLMVVNATGADNPNIFLEDSPVAGRLRVGVDAFQPIDLTNKTNLVISGGGGNDTIFLRNTVISAGLTILTANGDAGNDTINVQTTRVTTAVNGGDGTDIVNVGSNPAAPAASTLSGIAAGLLVNGNGGADTLNINDAGFGVGARYEITSTSVQRSNFDRTSPTARIVYATTETLNVNAGRGSDGIAVLSTPGATTNISANDGDDVICLCNNSNLMNGTINGGTGNDLLNYSTYTLPVTVNLSTAVFSMNLPAEVGGALIVVPASSATGTGGIADIQRVVGGSGNDTLIGNAEDNLLEGRDGNDILIGQAGRDSLLGGFGSDILLGGDDVDLIDALFGSATDPATAASSQPQDDALDQVNGLVARNFLFGGGGGDVLFARGPQDQLFGQGGFDILVIRNCADFFAGQLRLEPGDEGGVITTLDFAIRGQNLPFASSPPLPANVSAADCNQALPAAALPPAVAAAAGQNVTALPLNFLGSAESKANIVRGYYQRFLGRTPEAAGLQQWVAGLTAGAQPEDVLAGILGSAEYFGRFNNDPTAFLRSLYQDLLGRTASDAEIAGWVRGFGSTSRAAIVRGFVTSEEFRSNLIQSWYSHYLGRAADPAGVQAWLAQMRRGATQDQIQAALLASAEYRQLASRNFSLQAGDSNAAYVRSLYSRVLGRTASEAEVAGWLRLLGT